MGSSTRICPSTRIACSTTAHHNAALSYRLAGGASIAAAHPVQEKLKTVQAPLQAVHPRRRVNNHSRTLHLVSMTTGLKLDEQYQCRSSGRRRNGRSINFQRSPGKHHVNFEENWHKGWQRSGGGGSAYGSLSPSSTTVLRQRWRPTSSLRALSTAAAASVTATAASENTFILLSTASHLCGCMFLPIHPTCPIRCSSKSLVAPRLLVDVTTALS